MPARRIPPPAVGSHAGRCRGDASRLCSHGRPRYSARPPHRLAPRGRPRSRFAGADGVTPQAFAAGLDAELARLAEALATGTYLPRPYRRVVTRGAAPRTLHVPTVRDRVVEAMLLHALRPLVEPHLSDAAYGYRPGRSVAGARRHLAGLLAAGRPVALRADVRAFFPSVSHARVLAALDALGTSPETARLVQLLLAAPADAEADPAAPPRVGGRGLPVGSALSPLLSNLALQPLDRALEDAALPHVRYGDDLAVACRSDGEGRRALAVVEAALRPLGLALHPAKTRVVAAHGGVPFLGPRLFPMPASPTAPPALASTQVPAAPPRTLYVHTQGATVRTDGLRLEVRAPRGGPERGRVLARVGLPKVRRVVLMGAVAITPAALARALRAGVDVVWLSRRGALVGHAGRPADGPASTVRAQCAASANPDHRRAVARALVVAKLDGQRAVLVRRGRRLPAGPMREAVAQAARRLRDASHAAAGASDLDVLRGVEGAAAAAYFGAWPALLDGAPLAFGGRSRRPPRDPVNALLSFAYTLAHAQVRALAEAHGLHPAVGFLHDDRPGHATLASDLLEPLRPALDHALLAAIRAGRFPPDAFTTSDRGGVYLAPDARPAFFALLDRTLRRPRPWAPGTRSVLWTRLAAEPAALVRALRGETPYACPPYLTV